MSKTTFTLALVPGTNPEASRRGYVFHGPPGTGKSSLCFGMASLAQLCIFMVSLNSNDPDQNGLALLFPAHPKRCIILFEDIDQAGIQKRSTDSRHRRNQDGTDDAEETCSIETDDYEQRSSGITLSAFLNVIDGVSAQEGCILIMTTNHINQLDDALKRPGRVDMEIPFGYADRIALQEHFLAFYLKPSDDITVQEPADSIHPLLTPACPNWKLDEIINLSVTFADEVPPSHYAAAKVQNYLLLHRNNPVSAVRNVAG